MPCLARISVYLSLILSTLTLSSQDNYEPIFLPFEGTVYRLPFDSLNRGYRPYIYDLEPYQRITWQEINQDWRPSKERFPDIDLTQSFGIDFRSAVKIPTDGLYLFGMRSDDDSILWIDGMKVLNNSYNSSYPQEDKKKAMELSADTIYLEKGEHDIKIWYSQLYPNMMGVQFRAKFIEAIDRDDYIDYSRPLRLTYESALYELTSNHLARLEKWLKHIDTERKPHNISIIGYADEVGSNEANHILSLQRAQEVGDFIMTELDYQCTVDVSGQGELIGIGEHNRYVEVRLEQE
jgi:outer membrane protein OmpA-like peptidoglycan-associated protein